MDFRIGQLYQMYLIEGAKLNKTEIHNYISGVTFTLRSHRVMQRHLYRAF